MRLIIIRHAESANNKLWDDISEKYGLSGEYGPGVHIPPEAWVAYNEARSADPNISELGEAQAKACGEAMNTFVTKARAENADVKIKLRSSPMQRTLQTTMAIVNGCGSGMFPSFEVDNSIFEQGGCFTNSKLPALPGRSPEEISAAFPLARPLWTGKGWYEDYRISAGFQTPLAFESRGEAYERAKNIVKMLWKTDVTAMGERDVLILVVHADLLDALVKNLMSVQEDGACLVKMTNTGINEFTMRLRETGERQLFVEYLNNFAHLSGLT